MATLIKCPICMARILVDLTGGQRIDSVSCPACHQGFDPRKVVGKETNSVSNSDSNTDSNSDSNSDSDSVRSTRSSRKSRWRMEPDERLSPADPGSDNSASLQSDSSAVLEEVPIRKQKPVRPSPLSGADKSLPTDSPAVRFLTDVEEGSMSPAIDPVLRAAEADHKVRRRNRRNKIFFGLTLIGLSLGICLLAIPLYRAAILSMGDAGDRNPDRSQQTRQSPPMPAGAKLNGTVETIAPLDPLAPATVSSGQQDPQPEDDPSPPAFPRFLLFNRQQVQQIWNEARPQLLALEIEGPRGKQRGVGTIIDSRGWCLTSYQAVHDAWKIEVVAATPELSVASPDPPLRDSVRGLVWVEPDLDLAILAINRRFVVSLAELPIAAEDRMVPSMRLAALAPPNPKNFYGVSEVKIEQRGRLDEFPPEIRTRLAALPGDLTRLNWLALSGGIDLLPGTPLFDQQGQLRSMVSVQRQEVAYAVPLFELLPLKSRTVPGLIPLKGAVVEVDGQTRTAAVDHPAMLLAQQLRGGAENGRAFGWLPTDQPELQQLNEFLQHLQAGKDYLKNNKPDYRDPPEIQAAREMLRNAVDQTLGSLRNELQEAFNRGDRRLETLNQLSQQRMRERGETTVPVIVEVAAGASQLDFLVLQIESVQDYVTIPYDSTAPVMRPGSRWLILIRCPADRPVKSFRTAGDRRITAREVERITEIGPLQ